MTFYIKYFFFYKKKDEVLYEFVNSFIEFYNKKNDKKSLDNIKELRFTDFYSYNFKDVLNLSIEKTNEWIDEFHLNSIEFKKMKIIENSKKTLKFLKKIGFKFYLVSSRVYFKKKFLISLGDFNLNNINIFF